MVSPSMNVECVRPKDRAARIQNQIEQELLKIKEWDLLWEDQIDVRLTREF